VRHERDVTMVVIMGLLATKSICFLRVEQNKTRVTIRYYDLRQAYVLACNRYENWDDAGTMRYCSPFTFSHFDTLASYSAQ